MFDAVLISLKICSLNSHIDFDDSMYKVTKVVPPIELLTFASLLIVSIYNYDMILFLYFYIVWISIFFNTIARPNASKNYNNIIHNGKHYNWD